MTKKIIAVILLIALTVGAISFVFFSDDAKERGTFYTLQEAYDNKFINSDDLKNIAYYQNNGTKWYYDDDGRLLFKDWDYVPQDKNPTELNKKTVIDIKNTEVYSLRKSGSSKAKVNDISISYLGSYHNYIAIFVSNALQVRPDVIECKTIEGQVILYGDQIKVWINLKNTEV